MTGGVFINYRGEDSHSYGALLYTELSRHFGTDLVSLDSESIPAGADYAEQLLGRVRGCAVLLAVIGPRWLATTDPGGRRRMDDPGDWVRRELAEAFAAGVRVIPVLTDGAGLPAEADLPGEIVRLGRCQYRRLRHREATADLDRLRADLADADPGLAYAARRRSAPTSRPAAIHYERDRVVPRQLVAPPRLFTGRKRQLAALSSNLDTRDDAGATVVISAIGGAGGIGKTALAPHWAHQNLKRFPDGQLHVDLRGFDPSGAPVTPAVAVRSFLDALGMEPSAIPVDLDAQAALYRSLVAGKRMLVVLNNARSSEQVAPLLPGSPTCTVLVTSRRQLTSLVARYGARPLSLDVLTRAEARELFTRHVGDDRVAAESEAVTELLGWCVGLPIAISVVAARAAQHPDFPLAVLAEELREESARLDALDGGELTANLRAVFSWSYHALEPTRVDTTWCGSWPGLWTPSTGGEDTCMIISPSGRLVWSPHNTKTTQPPRSWPTGASVTPALRWAGTPRLWNTSSRRCPWPRPPVTSQDKPTPTTFSRERGDNGRITSGRWSMPPTLCTYTRPSTSGCGKPTRSTQWAGTWPGWATTSRPVLTATPPSLCFANTTTATARRTHSTAWATWPTTPATTHSLWTDTSRPSPCTATSAILTTKPTRWIASARPMRPSASTIKLATLGGRPRQLYQAQHRAADADRIQQQLDELSKRQHEHAAVPDGES